MSKLVSLVIISDVIGISLHENPAILNFTIKTVHCKYLTKGKITYMPVLKKPMVDIKCGDRVKFTFYSLKDNVEYNDSGGIIFTSDKGLKYEVFKNDSWELLYEDLLSIE